MQDCRGERRGFGDLFVIRRLLGRCVEQGIEIPKWCEDFPGKFVELGAAESVPQFRGTMALCTKAFLVSMKTSCEFFPSSAFISVPHCHVHFARTGQRLWVWNCGKAFTGSKSRIANLVAHRRQRIPFPTYCDESGRPKSLSTFLCEQAGIESMLNIKELQNYECLGDSVFRCTLPKVEFFKFEVVPVVDISVVANENECLVEMLSCKLKGSALVESQNDYFSASMRNHLTWDTSFEEAFLDIDVKINVSLKVYTVPFTLLPLSAVETPGNVNIFQIFTINGG
eukprot:c21738_g1_i2 orf=657-1505(-)